MAVGGPEHFMITGRVTLFGRNASIMNVVTVSSVSSVTRDTLTPRAA